MFRAPLLLNDGCSPLLSVQSTRRLLSLLLSLEMMSSTLSRALWFSPGGKPRADRRSAFSLLWLKTFSGKKIPSPPPEPPDPPDPPDLAQKSRSASDLLHHGLTSVEICLHPTQSLASTAAPPTASTPPSPRFCFDLYGSAKFSLAGRELCSGRDINLALTPAAPLTGPSCFLPVSQPTRRLLFPLPNYRKPYMSLSLIQVWAWPIMRDGLSNTTKLPGPTSPTSINLSQIWDRIAAPLDKSRDRFCSPSPASSTIHGSPPYGQNSTSPLTALTPASYQKIKSLHWPLFPRVTVHVMGRNSESNVSQTHCRSPMRSPTPPPDPPDFQRSLVLRSSYVLFPQYRDLNIWSKTDDLALWVLSSHVFCRLGTSTSSPFLRIAS